MRPIDWESAHKGIMLLLDASIVEVDATEARRRLSILQLELNIRTTALEVLEKAGLDPCGYELSDAKEAAAKGQVQ